MRIDRRILTLAFGGLFWRTFLLIALLIAVSLTAWFQSFRVIEREPRAQRVALQLVAVVKPHPHCTPLFRSRSAACTSAGSGKQRRRARVPARDFRQISPAAGRIAEPADRTRHPRPARRRYGHRAVGQRHSRCVDQLQDRRRRLLGSRSTAISSITLRACNGPAGVSLHWRCRCSARHSSQAS